MVLVLVAELAEGEPAGEVEAAALYNQGILLYLVPKAWKGPHNMPIGSLDFPVE